MGVCNYEKSQNKQKCFSFINNFWYHNYKESGELECLHVLQNGLEIHQHEHWKNEDLVPIIIPVRYEITSLDTTGLPVIVLAIGD